MLRDINIVDTPGTNAVLRQHEALTREFVPRADLVLFVTSADRPFTESERAFLQAIREWGKKVVVAVNKIDILETEEDLARVLDFVAENARALLGDAPRHLPGGRAARPAREDGPEARAGPWPPAASRPWRPTSPATLDQKERVRLKLLNPLGVGLRLLEKHLGVTEARLELLKEDFDTIENIDRQLALYQEDLARDFRFRLSDVEKVLLEFERRGMEFFDSTLRLGRIFDLVNQSRIKRAFDKEVLADLPRVVERRVEEVIDWMVASDLRQWQGVMEQLERRRLEARGPDRSGAWPGVFEHDRVRLLESVRREAARALETYDREAESRRLAESVQVAGGRHRRAAGGRPRPGHHGHDAGHHHPGRHDRHPGRGRRSPCSACSSCPPTAHGGQGRAAGEGGGTCARGSWRRSPASSTTSWRRASSASGRRSPLHALRARRARAPGGRASVHASAAGEPARAEGARGTVGLARYVRGGARRAHPSALISEACAARLTCHDGDAPFVL